MTHAVSVGIGDLVGNGSAAAGSTSSSGLAFLGFAAWTLRGDTLDDEEKRPPNGPTQGRVATIGAVGVTFFLAELGDKTMLATITLATREGAIGTWAGSTVGMVAADALAIVVGRQLGTRLPERTVRIGAATAFVVFGVLLLIEAARVNRRATVLDAIGNGTRYLLRRVRHGRISTAVGPWTPIVRICSISPVRLGPVTNTRLDGRRSGRPVSGRNTSDGLRTTRSAGSDTEVHLWQETGRAGAHRGAVEHQRPGGCDERYSRRDTEVCLGARLRTRRRGPDVDAEASERLTGRSRRRLSRDDGPPDVVTRDELRSGRRHSAPVPAHRRTVAPAAVAALTNEPTRSSGSTAR